jgi:hypothetical protein
VAEGSAKEDLGGPAPGQGHEAHAFLEVAVAGQQFESRLDEGLRIQGFTRILMRQATSQKTDCGHRATKRPDDRQRPVYARPTAYSELVVGLDVRQSSLTKSNYKQLAEDCNADTTKVEEYARLSAWNSDIFHTAVHQRPVWVKRYQSVVAVCPPFSRGEIRNLSASKPCFNFRAWAAGGVSVAAHSGRGRHNAIHWMRHRLPKIS